MIELMNITKRYKNICALRGVNLVFPRGSATAIAGQNGSGKTTMLSIAAGALRPSSGEVALEMGGVKAPIGRVIKISRIIGFLPQFDALFDELSVSDNIRFWAVASGVRPGRLNNNRYVCLMGLEELLSRPAGKLSGGQRRRLSICTRLISSPEALILDEPFAGLDMFFAGELISVLDKLKQSGKTIIYSAHGEGEVERLADRVITMRDGSIALDIEKSACIERWDNIGDLITEAVKAYD